MKRILTRVTVILGLAFLATGVLSEKVKAQPGGSVSFQVFYDNLAPYGQWVEDPAYGYVWIPSEGGNFRPYYSGGHWVMTEYGNMWTSDYAWGWAPFHYGRWSHDSYYGWVWIPDNEWGPAWVSWRSSSDYYGWAPMGPGISVSMSFNNYRPADDWWIFIAPTYMYQPRWHDYYQGNGGNTTIIQRTTIINNTYVNNSRTYVAGPRAADVQRITHKDVTVYKVGNDSKPGKAAIQNNVVNVYRPSIEKSGKETAPPKVMQAEHPINNQRLGDAGVKSSPEQKQNASPENKDTRNQINPERKTEIQKHQPQTAPQHEQPANRKPELRENSPTDALPARQGRENQLPKQNSPQQNQGPRRFPPAQEQVRPSKEQPSQPVTPRQRQENNPAPKQQQERQPAQQQQQHQPERNQPQNNNPAPRQQQERQPAQRQQQQQQPERNNPPQQNNPAPRQQQQQQERQQQPERNQQQQNIPAPQQQPQQQPDRNRPQQEAIPPKPDEQRTPEINQDRKQPK